MSTLSAGSEAVVETAVDVDDFGATRSTHVPIQSRLEGNREPSVGKVLVHRLADCPGGLPGQPAMVGQR